jgi:hypothetical protein
MGNMTVATIFIVAANVLMFLVGMSMAAVNPDGNVCQTNEGSLIQESIYGANTNYSVVNSNILADLPESEASPVSAGGTSITFTDIFNNILDWFKSAPGIKYIYNVVAAPYNILNCMGLPVEFVAGVGTLWYVVSLLILVGFLWGRD